MLKVEFITFSYTVFLDLIFKSSGIFATDEEIQGEIDTYVQGVSLYNTSIYYLI